MKGYWRRKAATSKTGSMKNCNKAQFFRNPEEEKEKEKRKARRDK